MTKFITNVSDDKLDIISQKISFNKSVSDDTKWQAVETNAYENKINNLWFKKITKLEQENKVLKEVNSKLLTVLKQNFVENRSTRSAYIKRSVQYFANKE